MKKILTLLLVLSMALTTCTVVFADGFNVIVDNKTASAGERVEVEVHFENNTGILSATFDLSYDTERLELIEVKDGRLLQGGTFSPNYKSNPYRMIWNSASYNNFTDDGTLVTFKFAVLDNAESGKAFVNINYDEDNVFDVNLNNVDINVVNGSVTVIGADDNEVSGGRRPGGVRPAVDSTTLPAVDNKEETVDSTKNQIILTIGEKEALVFGEVKMNDVAPLIRNDRTMLPARFVAENLGATVEWDETYPGYVTITKDNVKIVITIDSQIAIVNDEAIVLDSVAFIENDRTYTPLRFIAEKLGASVKWVEETQQVIITKK